MLTNISCKDVSQMAFGEFRTPKQKITLPFVSRQKLLGDIEALPVQDAHLGSLIVKDELFCKTLGAREVKVKPEKVRAFFKYLFDTLKTTDPKLDTRPMSKRKKDLAYFVEKVLFTIQKRKELAEEATIKIAGYNNIGEIY